MKVLARWIWLAFLLPMVVDFVLTRPFKPQEVKPPVELLEAALSAGKNPGHGAYCSPKSLPPVYMGRDVPSFDTYTEFQDWCKAQGGEIGWSA